MKELEGPKLGLYDRMLTGMARTMWAPLLVMGVLVVIISFFIGLSASNAASAYFANSKLVREAAEVGSQIVINKVYFETVFAWLPTFKFLGMALIFSGITMLLATILDALRRTGYSVQKSLNVNIVIPKKPWTGHLFPPVMMMGLMVLIATFIIGLVLAGVTGSYWNHVIATQLDVAEAGSTLLAQLATITAIKAWLTPLLFAGVALLLAGIGLALDTIRRTLKSQAVRLVDVVHELRDGVVVDHDKLSGRRPA